MDWKFWLEVFGIVFAAVMAGIGAFLIAARSGLRRDGKTQEASD